MNYKQAKLEQALQLHQSGRISDAINIYRELIASETNNPYLLFLLGTAYSQTAQSRDGLAYLIKSVQISPNPITYNNIGITFAGLGDHTSAITNFKQAIKLDQNYAEGYCNLGASLREAGLNADSLACLNKAIALFPNYAQAHLNKGNTLFDLAEYLSALESYKLAINSNPSYSEAYRGAGDALLRLDRSRDAINFYKKATSIKPDFSDAYHGLAGALKKLGHHDEAITNYGNAIAYNPIYAEAYYNRGELLRNIGRYEEALPDLEKAYALNPDIDCLIGAKFHAHMHLCDWKSFYIDLDELKSKIHQSANVSAPFVIHGLLDSPSLQRTSTEIFVKNKYPDKHKAIFDRPRNTRQTINIAYFSSDFRNHPVTHLLAGLFEAHDRSRFKITAFSLSTQTDDPWRMRVASAVDAFFDVQDKTDAEIASLARSLDIDIAIDLNGHTMHARTGIFAHRAAPIQASYIGFLGTSGAPYFDYLIADPFLIPKNMQDFYTEKIVYLPSYQCNDTKVDISDKIFNRSDFGLPTDAFVFCSFNNNYKITPPTFDSWMKILTLVDGSVLWIYVDNETAKTNLRKEAAHRGVDPARLIFANKLPLNEHLSRQRLADLFLDTYPYNAGATATNALRVGLPLITRSGDSFASRYGTSILNAVGLPELVTNSAEAFESLAVELATNRQLYTSIKGKLHHNLPNCTLYDTQRFTKSIESAFTQMHQRLCHNLNSEHIYV